MKFFFIYVLLLFNLTVLLNADSIDKYSMSKTEENYIDKISIDEIINQMKELSVTLSNKGNKDLEFLKLNLYFTDSSKKPINKIPLVYKDLNSNFKLIQTVKNIVFTENLFIEIEKIKFKKNKSKISIAKFKHYQKYKLNEYTSKYNPTFKVKDKVSNLKLYKLLGDTVSKAKRIEENKYHTEILDTIYKCINEYDFVNKHQGTVMGSFTINKNLTIDNLKTTKSSTHKALNDLTIEIIEDCKKNFTIPKNDNTLIEFDITYRIQ